MKKKIIGILIAAVAVIATIIVLISVFNNTKKIDAEERVSMEMEYVQNLTNFVEQVDNITAAYTSAQIDKEAYKERHEVLQNEFYILKNEYSIWLNNNPIKTGSDTYVTKRGEQAIINMQQDIDKLLDCTFDNGEPYDIYQLYYRYLLQKDKVRSDSIEFVVAYKWLKDKQGDYEDLVQEYQNRIEEEIKNGQE